MVKNLIEIEDMKIAWEGFDYGNWTKEIDVRDFIQKNYKPYEGDQDFLEDASENTKSLWNKASELIQDEVKNKTISVELEYNLMIELSDCIFEGESGLGEKRTSEVYIPLRGGEQEIVNFAKIEPELT